MLAQRTGRRENSLMEDYPLPKAEGPERAASRTRRIAAAFLVGAVASYGLGLAGNYYKPGRKVFSGNPVYPNCTAENPHSWQSVDQHNAYILQLGDRMGLSANQVQNGTIGNAHCEQTVSAGQLLVSEADVKGKMGPCLILSYVNQPNLFSAAAERQNVEVFCAGPDASPA
jgi:hypothetical protein